MAFLWFPLLILVGNGVNLISAFPADLEIINGDNTTISNYPWMVSLWTRQKTFKCAGFLISPSWVVSSAQCSSADMTHARGGSNKMDSEGVTVEIEEVIVHPKYFWRNLHNDILLLRLKTPLVGDNIEPIELPDSNTEITEGDILTIAGWGSIVSDKIVFPDTLQEVNITVVNLQSCKEIYDDAKYIDYVTENVICAESLGVEKGICYGDAGGAAIWNEKPVGIVSFAINCASTEYPTGFTKVSNYVDWIRNVTNI